MDIRTMVTGGINFWRQHDECEEAVDTVTVIPVCAPEMKTDGLGMQFRVRASDPPIPTIKISKSIIH